MKDDEAVRLLLAFQPYRGTVVRSGIPDVITKGQLAELVALGYLSKDGTAKNPRYHFTVQGYRFLGEPKR